MEAYILSAEICLDKVRRLDTNEIKQFINFIEGIIPKKLDLLYSNSMFNLHKEFQCALASLRSGLELIFILEESLLRKGKPFTLRYVLTHGEIEVPRRKHMFYGMVGNGIGRAVSKMERLRQRRGDRFYVDFRDREESAFMTSLLCLYQRLYDSWHARDYALAASLIDFWDYNMIAKDMGKTPSLIWKRRKSLGIQQYYMFKDLILKAPDLIIRKTPSKTNEQPPAF